MRLSSCETRLYHWLLQWQRVNTNYTRVAFCQMSGGAWHAGRKGALLCSEGLARLREFQGDHTEARHIFREAEATWPPSARFLREWALFEKRRNELEVLRMPPPPPLSPPPLPGPPTRVHSHPSITTHHHPDCVLCSAAFRQLV